MDLRSKLITILISDFNLDFKLKLIRGDRERQYICIKKKNSTNPDRSILITLHKTRNQIEKRPQHKTRYNGREIRKSGE